MNLQKLLDQALAAVSEKQRFVIEKRYGLDGGSPMTLEAIGQELDLTRERIRQIENAALKILREEENLSIFDPVLSLAERQLEDAGGIVQENIFLDEMVHLLGEEHENRNVVNNILEFVFTLYGRPMHKAENKKFYPTRFLSKNHLEEAQNFLKQLEKISRKVGEPMSPDEYANTLELAMKETGIENEVLAAQYLGISKQFGVNPYGDFGLRKWPEIEPRGVREKAHLVLKKSGDPMHFVDISSTINDMKFDERVAQPQTVHNELIKDERFVLCGRGIYGLKEWGLEPGTVKDVIGRILEKRGPLHQEEVVQLVKKQRYVKDTTIVLGLQDKDSFKRLDDGRYHVNTV